MKKTALTITAVALAISAAAAQAQYRGGYRQSGQSYGPYFGASVGQLSYNEDGFDTITPTVVMFRGGFQFNPMLSVEGRLGASVESANTRYFGTPVNVNVNSIYGAYVRGSVPLSPQFSIYGLAGVTGANFRVRAFGASATTTDTSASFGVGADLALGGGASLNAEWGRFISGGEYFGSRYTADVLTVGVLWHF